MTTYNATIIGRKYTSASVPDHPIAVLNAFEPIFAEGEGPNPEGNPVAVVAVLSTFSDSVLPTVITEVNGIHHELLERKFTVLFVSLPPARGGTTGNPEATVDFNPAINHFGPAYIGNGCHYPPDLPTPSGLAQHPYVNPAWFMSTKHYAMALQYVVHVLAAELGLDLTRGVGVGRSAGAHAVMHSFWGPNRAPQMFPGGTGQDAVDTRWLKVFINDIGPSFWPLFVLDDSGDFTAWAWPQLPGNGTGFLVNNPGGYSSGATSIAADTGVGNINAGDKIKFAGHAAQYRVASGLSGSGPGGGGLTYDYGRKYEPPVIDGIPTVIQGVGHWPAENTAYLGTLTLDQLPAIHGINLNIGLNSHPFTKASVLAALNAIDVQRGTPSIGVTIRDHVNPLGGGNFTGLDDVYLNTEVFDDQVDILADALGEFDKPFMLDMREVNSPGNGYHEATLGLAFRKLISRLIELGVTKGCYQLGFEPTPFVDPDTPEDQLDPWFLPVADLIDWIGLDIAQKLPQLTIGSPAYIHAEAICDYADANQRPVFLLEVHIVGSDLPQGGTIPDPPTDATQTYDYYCGTHASAADTLFGFIAAHRVIKGFKTTNHLHTGDMTLPPFNWKNERLYHNETFRTLYVDEVTDASRYIGSVDRELLNGWAGESGEARSGTLVLAGAGLTQAVADDEAITVIKTWDWPATVMSQVPLQVRYYGSPLVFAEGASVFAANKALHCYATAGEVGTAGPPYDKTNQFFAETKGHAVWFRRAEKLLLGDGLYFATANPAAANGMEDAVLEPEDLVPDQGAKTVAWLNFQYLGGELPLPIEEKVLRAVEAVLKGITLANGFNTDVKRVLRWEVWPEELPDTPAIMVEAAGGQYDDGVAYRFEQGALTIGLQLVLTGWEDRTTRVSRFIADVRRALHLKFQADHFTQLSVNFHILSSQRQTAELNGTPVCGATLVIEVIYRNVLEDTYTQQ